MYNNAVVNLPIAPNTSGNPRIDRVIVTIDEVNARAIQITVLAGIPAVSPVPPTLTQNTGTTFQLSLAQVAVASGTNQILAGNITDERWTQYCGVMAATMGKFSVQTDGSLNGGGMNIHNIADPVSAQDAATMHYISNLFTAQRGLVKVTIITNPSITSFTTQPTTQYMDFLLVGGCGGGGGGGSGYSGGAWGGGGGGGGGVGATLQAWGLTVAGNTPYTIAVGAGGVGGAGGSPNNSGTGGGSGGTTEIIIGGTTYSSSGGGGGNPGSWNSTRNGAGGAGGGGGSPSGSIFGISGSGGASGNSGSSSSGGAGGCGYSGLYNASCYAGSGGNGGAAVGSGGSGGAGTAGFMIIWEWS
jgi:hypothetical protein